MPITAAQLFAFDAREHLREHRALVDRMIGEMEEVALADDPPPFVVVYGVANRLLRSASQTADRIIGDRDGATGQPEA